MTSNPEIVKIALIQSAAASSRENALRDYADRIREAAADGARIVCTPELFMTEYFCWKQDPDFFDLAEPIPGPTTEFFSALAKECGVVLILSLFEKAAPGIAYNAVAILDADGTYLGKYRKMHIPQDPGFEEKFYFTPGDQGFRAWDTKFGRIGVIICWDQWYPESARITALDGADIVFCPTAIGTIAEEDDALMSLQRHAWLAVQHGHAVANACFYAAVNRIGTEHGARFWGSSFVSDFYGRDLASAPQNEPCILYAECNLKEMEAHRRMWPFFRDRRIDAYSPILSRYRK